MIAYLASDAAALISPAFDARPVAEIHEPHVRRWREDLLDAGVSAVTVAKAYRLLKAIFNTAVDDGLIRRNPVLLAALTSLRWGELAALRRSDIDIQARTVRVARQLNEQHGGGFAFSPPKSQATADVLSRQAPCSWAGSPGSHRARNGHGGGGQRHDCASGPVPAVVGSPFGSLESR